MARKSTGVGEGATARCLSLVEVADMLEGCDRVAFEACKEALKSDTRKGVAVIFQRTERRLAAEEAEAQRLAELYAFEAQLAECKGAQVWVGLDEVGRGPVAGPLAAGAVVLDPACSIGGLNDSKQVPEADRERIAAEIKNKALAWAVSFVDNRYIDAHGMTASLKKAFSEALAQVEAQLTQQGKTVDLVLLDGNPLGFDGREENIVKGDSKCASIAAASIIAKVARDALMVEYAKEYPAYGWDSNKGYASEHHREAIAQHGLTPLHRASFCTAFEQMSLF